MAEKIASQMAPATASRLTIHALTCLERSTSPGRSLLEWTGADAGGGAAGEPCPADGPGAVARRASRRRARSRGPCSERQGAGLPQGEGAAPGAAAARRPRAPDDGGRREPHRRLVLER